MLDVVYTTYWGGNNNNHRYEQRGYWISVVAIGHGRQWWRWLFSLFYYFNGTTLMIEPTSEIRADVCVKNLRTVLSVKSRCRRLGLFGTKRGSSVFVRPTSTSRKPAVKGCVLDWKGWAAQCAYSLLFCLSFSLMLAARKPDKKAFSLWPAN